MIRILLDENLPASLADKLGVTCMHATQLGEQPTDSELWEHAQREGWTLLTKDADFFDQLMLKGAPPKVIWLRTGNMRRAELESMLEARWSRILELIERVDLVEVHKDQIEAIRISR